MPTFFNVIKNMYLKQEILFVFSCVKQQDVFFLLIFYFVAAETIK